MLHSDLFSEALDRRQLWQWWMMVHRKVICPNQSGLKVESDANYNGLIVFFIWKNQNRDKKKWKEDFYFFFFKSRYGHLLPSFIYLCGWGQGVPRPHICADESAEHFGLLVLPDRSITANGHFFLPITIIPKIRLKHSKKKKKIEVFPKVFEEKCDESHSVMTLCVLGHLWH